MVQPTTQINDLCSNLNSKETLQKLLHLYKKENPRSFFRFFISSILIFFTFDCPGLWFAFSARILHLKNQYWGTKLELCWFFTIHIKTDYGNSWYDSKNDQDNLLSKWDVFFYTISFHLNFSLLMFLLWDSKGWQFRNNLLI